MSSRIAFLLAALALLLAAIVYDARLTRQFWANREATELLARRFDEVERLIRLQGRPSPRLAGDSAGTRQVPGRAIAANAGAASASATISVRDTRELIAGDVKLRAKYMNDFRDGLDTQYGIFVHILGLSPTDEIEFKQLMANSEANKLQVAETAADEGLDTDDPQMKALGKQLNGPDWKSLKQLLGPSGIVTLQQYWSEWPVVTLVQNFGGNLPEPTLTVTQAQELLPVLGAASQRDATGTVIPDTINVQQALNAAAPILTAQQLLTLSAMLQEAEAKAKISQLSQGQ